MPDGGHRCRLELRGLFLRFPSALLILLSVWLSALAGAGESPRPETYVVQGKRIGFLNDSEKNFTVSKSCLKEPGHYECDAVRALSKASLRNLPPHSLDGGVSPGGVICRHIGGTLVKGFSDRGYEAQVCRFHDGSMATTDSVHAYGLVHDRETH